jgi:hypothetical protein
MVKDLVKTAKRSIRVGILILLLICTAVGYFYGGATGGLAILILGISYWLSVTISRIPFIGIVIQYFVMAFIFQLAEGYGVMSTGLTSFVFYTFIILGLIVCLLKSMAFTLKVVAYLLQKKAKTIPV